MPSTFAAFQISASMPRRPASRIAMVTPRALPDAGDDQAVDRRVRDRRAARSGSSSSPRLCIGCLHAEIGIEHPLPDQARDDQRHGEGIEEDRAQQVFLPDALVHEHGEQDSRRPCCSRSTAAPKIQMLWTATASGRSPTGARYCSSPTKWIVGEELGAGERPEEREGDADDEDADRDEDHRDSADDGMRS